VVLRRGGSRLVDGAPKQEALMSSVSRRPDHIGAWTHADRHEAASS
jgi:hypothetical protein